MWFLVFSTVGFILYVIYRHHRHRLRRRGAQPNWGIFPLSLYLPGCSFFAKNFVQDQSRWKTCHTMNVVFLIGNFIVAASNHAASLPICRISSAVYTFHFLFRLLRWGAQIKMFLWERECRRMWEIRRERELQTKFVNSISCIHCPKQPFSLRMAYNVADTLTCNANTSLTAQKISWMQDTCFVRLIRFIAFDTSEPPSHVPIPYKQKNHNWICARLLFRCIHLRKVAIPHV